MLTEKVSYGLCIGILSITEKGKITKSELITTVEENKVTVIREDKNNLDTLEFSLAWFEDFCCCVYLN